jgi:hypothetical protein
VENSQQVDLIELNHYFADGSHSFDQVIFYEWSPQYRRFDVLGYWLAEKLEDYPIKIGDSHYAFKNHEGRRQRITGKLFRETWTTFDPERDQKRLLSENCRLGILRGTRSILER